jgi:hypothetical protein
MATLLQDIKAQSEWIVKAFSADNLKLDYSVRSLIEVDKFFNKHTKNGKAIKGGRLSKNLGPVIFSIGFLCRRDHYKECTRSNLAN